MTPQLNLSHVTHDGKIDAHLLFLEVHPVIGLRKMWSNCSAPAVVCIMSLATAVPFATENSFPPIPNPPFFYVLIVSQIVQDPAHVLGFEYAGVSVVETGWLGTLHVINGFQDRLNVGCLTCERPFETLRSTAVVIGLFSMPC